MVEIQEVHLSLIQFYRDNPIIALKELLDVELAIPQRIIFKDMWFNKFVIQTASRGVGKCVAGDTLIPTSEGILRIEDMGSELDPLSDINHRVIGYDGIEKASKWYYDGIKEVNRIKTDSGYSLSATDDHRIKCLTTSGEIVWKYACDVIIGDIVPIERTRSIWSNKDSCSIDEAYVEGLWCLDFDTDKNRCIPKDILKSSKKTVSAFISGLFESYAKCEEGHISFCSKSKRLAEEVHVVLLNFGIISKLKETFINKNLTYSIEIFSDNLIIFKREIGFMSKEQIKALDSACFINAASVKPLEYYGSKYNFFFDIVKSVDRGLDKVYDLVVPESHSFVANGFVNHNSFLCAAFACLYAMLYPGTRIGLLAPSFRQGRNTFEEVKTIWNKSSILREASNGKPTMQSDRCVLFFKTVGGRPHSLIESDPLGTGEKIRGIRMHVLLIDEFAQMPEEIFDAVIKPMAATYSSPMENVRRLEHIKRLKAAGADVSMLEGDSTVNKIIVVSSAFYKFNHMYKRIQNYERLIASGKPGYVVRNTNYLDMPPGFMNEDIIAEAKETMPQSVFRMEYLSVWESDSEGVFKASLLEACRLPFSEENSVKMFSEDDKEYVVGCDPARTTDAFALVVIELGKKNKVVNAYKHTEITFPQMADALVAVCERYNVIRVVIDSQGGGNAIKDLVCDTVKYGNKALIDIDDPNMVGVDGKRILQLVNPSPKFNADANYSTLSLLEHGKMFFPCRPIGGNEAEEGAYEVIDEMISQMRSIVVTETRSGVAHFDVPVGGGHGKQKKDLYSAMIYASNKISEMENEGTLPDKIIWGSGVIVPISGKVRDSVEPIRVSPFAVLTKK